MTALDGAVRPLCAGHPQLYDYENLPGRIWVERRLVAMRMCHGCPLLGAECARRALADDVVPAMVWSGVPVPPSSHIADRRRALAALRELAGHE